MEKEISIHCDSNGMKVSGACPVGSTSDTVASSLAQFLRVAENWWHTYVGRDIESDDPVGMDMFKALLDICTFDQISKNDTAFRLSVMGRIAQLDPTLIHKLCNASRG